MRAGELFKAEATEPGAEQLWAAGEELYSSVVQTLTVDDINPA